MYGLMSDLVICKFRKSMIIHDTECPYWDQVSLNNTSTNSTLFCCQGGSGNDDNNCQDVTTLVHCNIVVDHGSQIPWIRKLVLMFLHSFQKYRDYYEIIKHPIDLKVIAIKIQQNTYNSLAEMFSDVMLLVSNAKTFNEPGSQIYKVRFQQRNFDT